MNYKNLKGKLIGILVTTVPLIWPIVVLADFNRPEEELFIPAAQEAIKKYQIQYGHNPHSWYELNMRFSCQPYHIKDPGLYPTSANVKFWRPKECELEYELVEGTNMEVRTLIPPEVIKRREKHKLEQQND